MIPLSPSSPSSYYDMLSHDLARGTAGLPLLPKGAREALRLAQSPDAGFEDVAKLAEADPPLAARVLAVANSALYSRGIPVTSVHRALVRLGMQATRDVLYQAVYAAMLFDAPGYSELVAATFRHGVVTGHVARQIVHKRGGDRDAAYLAGLLHDVGEARCWKLASKRVRFGQGGEELFRAVDALHARAGAELAALWKLPEEVAEACLWHHQPEGRPVALVIAAADKVARRVEPTPRSTDEEILAAINAIAFDPEEIPALLQLAVTQQQTSGQR
jgi:putative nucleotidyltransferase with HDIG domain